MWFCQTIYISVTYTSKHFMLPKSYCFVRNNDKSSNKCDTSNMVGQCSLVCSQYKNMTKWKNNFEIHSQVRWPNLQRQEAISHRFHMLHIHNLHFIFVRRDVKIYVPRKFNFYGGQCVCMSHSRDDFWGDCVSIESFRMVSSVRLNNFACHCRLKFQWFTLLTL